jgi:nitroreductase
MDVIEALYGRFSARAFQPRAIPKETLMKIFEAAVRAPSWADSQPWEVYLAAGATLDKLRKANLELFKSGAPRAIEVPGSQKWPDEIQSRIERNMEERSRELGLAREDKAGRQKLTEHNFRFFGAPAVAFLCMDKTLSSWSSFDMGAFSFGLMLAAREFGVDSVPAVMMVSYPVLIRETLNIPANLTILFAVALGYQDEADPLNKFRSIRRPADEITHFFGV